MPLLIDEGICVKFTEMSLLLPTLGLALSDEGRFALAPFVTESDEVKGIGKLASDGGPFGVVGLIGFAKAIDDTLTLLGSAPMPAPVEGRTGIVTAGSVWILGAAEIVSVPSVVDATKL